MYKVTKDFRVVQVSLSQLESITTRRVRLEWQRFADIQFDKSKPRDQIKSTIESDYTRNIITGV